jgi:Domain of unknown function (DUF222)
MCAPQSVAEALGMARAAVDYLNTPDAADLDGAACGEALVALGEVQAKLAAAQTEFLRRFDAADAHDADGYGSSSAWLAARTRISRKDAKAAVRDMRRFAARPLLRDAVAAGEISRSWADAITEWTKKLPAEMLQQTDKILLQAAAAGAVQDDLATIAGLAIEKWRQQRPDADEDRFEDRYVRVGHTFGGAGAIRGDLTPECTAAVTAVFDALGKKRGAEDRRTRQQRFHDALQEACQLLIGARMVPDRAGADTQVIVHIPLGPLRGTDGASQIEEAFIRAKLGEPGYLAGKDAEVAACDAMIVPVVTGYADMTVIDKIINLVLATAHGSTPAQAPDPASGAQPAEPASGEDAGTSPADQDADAAGGGMSPAAWQAHRYAIARLAIDFVSGPGGLASALRTGLLEPPCNTPSLPLDIGCSDSIPAHIRRAVALRDKHCAWPGGCDTPAAACDVHHLKHKKDGGPTSVCDCALFCKFHHLIGIHRWGWQVILHPDGTLEATSPDGRQTLRKHPPAADPDG